MSKLLADNYTDLKDILLSSVGDTLGVAKKIGNNVTAEFVKSEYGWRDILIRLHTHPIVRLEHDSCFKSGPVEFTLAGYNTPLTRRLVNQFIANDFSEHSVCVRQGEVLLDDEAINWYDWYRVL